MHLVHSFASQVVIEFMEDNEGINQYVTILHRDCLVFGGVAAVGFNFVFLGQANFQSRYINAIGFG